MAIYGSAEIVYWREYIVVIKSEYALRPCPARGWMGLRQREHSLFPRWRTALRLLCTNSSSMWDRSSANYRTGGG